MGQAKVTWYLSKKYHERKQISTFSFRQFSLLFFTNRRISPMERTIKRQQLIVSIQKYAEENDYSASDMLKIVNERGGDISDTTMRRIIKGESVGFDTLRRVSAALFDVNATPLPAAEVDTAQLAELEALRAMAALTEVALKDANAKVEKLEQKLAEADKQLEAVTGIAAFRRQQMVEKDAQIAKLLDLLSKR
jgi:hypothetical protein